MNQKITKADELFFVVDKDDRPQKPLARKLVHGRGIWHRVAHVWLWNNKGQILCQQRSLEKELLPGIWEPFFGGHMRPEESYEACARRELQEELGIRFSKSDIQLWKVYKATDPGGYNNEFQGVFLAHWNGSEQDVTFDDGEVEQVAWKDLVDVQQLITTFGSTSWKKPTYELDLLAEEIARRKQ